MKKQYIQPSADYRYGKPSLAYKVLTVSLLALLALGFILAFGGII